MKISLKMGLCAALAAVVIGGCTDEKRQAGYPETKKTFVLFPTPALVAYKSDARPQVASRIVVDPRIARACDMVEPKFEFDSADVQLDPKLEKLAKCFAEGPMQGRTVYLVGRTDPRGDAQYNLELGKRRAESLATFLENRGVHEMRVITATRGEREAVGVDEQGWAGDRRVDILLIDDTETAVD